MGLPAFLTPHAACFVACHRFLPRFTGAASLSSDSSALSSVSLSVIMMCETFWNYPDVSHLMNLENETKQVRHHPSRVSVVLVIRLVLSSNCVVLLFQALQLVEYLSILLTLGRGSFTPVLISRLFMFLVPNSSTFIALRTSSSSEHVVCTYASSFGVVT